MTAELDSGPSIVQGRVRVLADDTVDALAARVLAVEHRIYPLALQLVAEGRAQLIDGHCVIDGKPSAHGIVIDADN